MTTADRGHASARITYHYRPIPQGSLDLRLRKGTEMGAEVLNAVAKILKPLDVKFSSPKRPAKGSFVSMSASIGNQTFTIATSFPSEGDVWNLIVGVRSEHPLNDLKNWDHIRASLIQGLPQIRGIRDVRWEENACAGQPEADSPRE